MIRSLPFKLWIPMWLLEPPEETPVEVRSHKWPKTGKRTYYGEGLWTHSTQVMTLYGINRFKQEVGSWRFRTWKETAS